MPQKNRTSCLKCFPLSRKNVSSLFPLFRFFHIALISRTTSLSLVTHNEGSFFLLCNQLIILLLVFYLFVLLSHTLLESNSSLQGLPAGRKVLIFVKFDPFECVLFLFHITFNPTPISHLFYQLVLFWNYFVSFPMKLKFQEIKEI